jgi:hypothetical protein
VFQGGDNWNEQLHEYANYKNPDVLVLGFAGLLPGQAPTRIPQYFGSGAASSFMYFGWADPQLNPRAAVEYYGQVTNCMGDSTRISASFMMPACSTSVAGQEPAMKLDGVVDGV